MSWLKSNSHWLISVCLLLIISIPAVLPLLHDGFFLTDDGEWMIIRFSAFYQAFTDGQFPVRFLHRLNFDYGYPVATFLYPGFMYAAVPFHIFKIGFVDTIKIILGGSLIGTTIFTYLWLVRVFKKRIAALSGAIVSLYLPYHLYDVYTRGSVGEIFALFWVAFILWMIERKSIFFVSIGIAMLLISHNTIALLFLPFLFIYAFLRNIFPFRQFMISVFFGLLLAAFFIIPVIFELSLTNFSQIKIANPLQYFASIQLVGVATFLIFFLSLVLFLSKKKLSTDNKLVVSFVLFVTFLGIFFSSSFSSIFWQVIPSSFIQFPFRLLSYFVVTSAFLTAFIISEIQHVTKRVIILVCLAGLVIFSSLTFVQPREYFDKGEGYYFTNDATTTVQDEYMPVWSKEKLLQRAEKKVEIIQGEGKIGTIVYNNKQMTFVITAKENLRVRINVLYWPGWNTYIDDKIVSLSHDNPKGVIEFAVAKGTHQVKADFSETPLRFVADMISIVSFCLLLFLVFRSKYR